MHLRHGRTVSPTKTTPIALHSLQRHLHPPLRSSLWTPPHLRAPSHPRLDGRARHGIARTRMRISTSRTATSHNGIVRICRMKRPLSHHTCLALKVEPNYLLKPLPSSLDSTRGGHNVSTHTNLKMERAWHHALDHRHLWCDKVTAKRILSTVLSVS